MRRTTEESFAGFAEIMHAIRGTGIGTACGMATTFGCPFEGFQKPERIYAFAQRLADLGVGGIALADTVGMGNPKQVLDISREVAKRLPHIELALHLHNTRGMGLANVVAGLEAGITHYESSLGGLGGCRSRPARPATSAPKISCTCWRAWATTPASTSTASSAPRAACRRSSATTCPAK